MKAAAHLLALLILINAAAAASIMPVKCNGEITMTNEFSEGDDLCVYGTGFAPGETIDLYVTLEKDTYTQGEDYEDLSGQAETATTNEQGILGLRKLWENVKQGVYDLIADRNRDGKYDEGDVVNDAKHDPTREDGSNEKQPEPAEEVPEFGTLAALATLIGAGIIISKRRDK